MVMCPPLNTLVHSNKFSPVTRVPGTDCAPLYLCAAATSANPRRTLQSEKKKNPSELGNVRGKIGFLRRISLIVSSELP